jgi:DTW domain-containing protein
MTERAKRGAAEDVCPSCHRPRGLCVCDRVVPLATERRVLILQHPREQDFALGTAGLVAASLPRATLKVGLSWASLAQALGHDAEPNDWAVVYPLSRDKMHDDAAKKGSVVLIDRHGKTGSPRRLKGIVLLDGSWSQAKALWWRNPWLLKLKRLTVVPREPSIYGSLRAEPRRDYVSTLEAAAEALSAAGEDPEVRAALLRLFRTLAQRARDAR